MRSTEDRRSKHQTRRHFADYDGLPPTMETRANRARRGEDDDDLQEQREE